MLIPNIFNKPLTSSDKKKTCLIWLLGRVRLLSQAREVENLKTSETRRYNAGRLIDDRRIVGLYVDLLFFIDFLDDVVRSRITS